MHEDQLNTKPSARQLSILASLGVLLMIASLFAIAYGRLPLSESYGYLGFYAATTFICEAFTAILLFSQFRNSGQFTFALMSIAYGWVALMAPFQIALLTNTFSNVPVVSSTPDEAAWLWTFWHLGFPIIIALAMALDGGDPVATRHFKRWAVFMYAAATVLALYCIFAVTFNWMDFPKLISEQTRYSSALSLIVGPLVIMCNLIALCVVVIKGKFANAVYSWLALAMLAATCESIVVIYSGERFSLGWYAARGLNMVSSLAVITALLLETVHLHQTVVLQNRSLKRMATTDGLSGLANRRAFDERIVQEIKRSKRERQPLGLILLDIDHFKRFNDTYGHLNGDLCIKFVSRWLSQFAPRSTDMCARFGGEEFAILLPNTNEADAVELAHQIRRKLSHQSLELDNGEHVIVTASFGVATLIATSEDDSNELIKIADEALYSAKREGRNRVGTPPVEWSTARQQQESRIASNIHFLRHG